MQRQHMFLKEKVNVLHKVVIVKSAKYEIIGGERECLFKKKVSQFNDLRCKCVSGICHTLTRCKLV